MENSQLLSNQAHKKYQAERIASILNILEKDGYTTVKHLVKTLNYSNATINRDLNVMKQQQLVKRSYGGIELITNKGIKLPFRYEKMKAVKVKIAKTAAEYIEDGDVVFIDGSTTAEYIGQYLLEKRDITVITNNMALAAFLSSYSIRAICLGGQVIEPPYMLMSGETVTNAKRYRADKAFFSTSAISMNGNIFFDAEYELLHQTMIDNSLEKFYLVDSSKQVDKLTKVMGFEELDYIISDLEIPQETQIQYPDTVFIRV